MEPKIAISEYSIENDVILGLKISSRNIETDKWAITHDNTVWDFNLKEFVYEPMPSNRTDEFINATRKDLIECTAESFEVIKIFKRQLPCWGL